MTPAAAATPPSPPLLASVIVPTYNRPARVARLLEQLASQTLPPDCFEVIVVDDGSDPPIAGSLSGLKTPFQLTVLARPNGGPAAARHAGILRARAELLVLIDDDMLVPPDFLREHVRAHPPAARRVVLGHLRGEPEVPLSLFECRRLRSIDRKAAAVGRGHILEGASMYTGNVSLRRADYFAAGGFDPAFRLAEDLELGIRLALIGAEFTVSQTAYCHHAPEPDSVEAWCRRAIAYGASEARIALKLHDLRSASPWRYLPPMGAFQRQLLLASTTAPDAMRRVATLLMRLAAPLYRLHRRERAMRLGALAYALLYYTGVRRELGSRSAARADWRAHLTKWAGPGLGFGVRWTKLWCDLDADRAAVRRAGSVSSAAPRGTLIDLLTHDEIQPAAAYRLMRFFRDVGLMLPAKLVCRLMRHVFAVHIHWDADIAPGVVLKGAGIVIGSGVRVGTGSMISERATLDRAPDQNALSDAPSIGKDVVIGPGAAILGPISVGDGAFIAPRSVLTHSVNAGSHVDVRHPTTRPRATRSARSFSSAPRVSPMSVP